MEQRLSRPPHATMDPVLCSKQQVMTHELRRGMACVDDGDTKSLQYQGAASNSLKVCLRRLPKSGSGFAHLVLVGAEAVPDNELAVLARGHQLYTIASPMHRINLAEVALSHPSPRKQRQRLNPRPERTTHDTSSSDYASPLACPEMGAKRVYCMNRPVCGSSP